MSISLMDIFLYKKLYTLGYIALFAALFSFTTSAAEDSSLRTLFIGTYTGSNSLGIYSLQLDIKTGRLTQPILAGEIKNPSFLAIHPTLDVLYAASEVGDSKLPGVAAFAINRETRTLKQINQQSSGGSGPCYVSIDPTGQVALLANYNDGSVCSYLIDKDGSLKPIATTHQHDGKSIHPERQTAPHAHCFVPDDKGEFALCADLGTDEIWVYAIQHQTGEISLKSRVSVRPGAGPRHIAISKKGIVYVVNELDNTIAAYAIDPLPTQLKLIATEPTLPKDFVGENTTAEIAIHPNGKFVYCSNRGADTIAVFRVNDNDSLTLIANTPTQGKTPRHFAIDPTGQFLIAANQNSNTLVVFQINSQTGLLTATGSTVEVPTPVCIRFLDK